MKKTLFLVLILMISLSNTAQEYRKYWKEGKLTLNDFQANENKRHSSYLAYTLTYQTDKRVIDNIVYNGLFSDAYIDKSLSFIQSDLKGESYLKYNQVLFNLIELSKRKLQQRLLELDNIFEANSLLMDSKNHLERRILNFQEIGNYGGIKSITKKWLQLTEEELKTTNTFPLNYKKSNWTYGMYGGLDFGIYGDTYKEIFNNTLALAMGFEFSYKNTFLLLNMSLTNSKLNKTLQHNSFTIPKGKKSTITMFNAAFGHPVYETKKLKIMPFAGYGLTSFEEVSKDKNKGSTVKGTSFFGFNIDFKNRKKVNFSPTILNIREEGNSFVRARVFISNSNFNPNLKGYSINIGIAYGFEARLLSKK